MIKFLIFLIVLTTIEQAFAHSENDSHPSQLQTLASFSYRQYSEEPSHSDSIPGILIGGEASPAHNGLSLDDAQIIGTLSMVHNYWLDSQISVHSHDEENSIDLEQFSIGTFATNQLGRFEMQVGKLSSSTTDTATWHASNSEFNEASLLSDAFFGRHHSDLGITFKHKTNFVTTAAEIWNGNSWPTTADNNNASVYTKMQFSSGQLNYDSGIWAMRGKAANRGRAQKGHNHDSTSANTAHNNYLFSGDISSYGFYGHIAWNLTTVKLSSEIEWISQRTQGVIANRILNSTLESNHQGMRAQLSALYKSHAFSLCLEELHLENQLRENIPSIFTEEANLMENDFDPQKTRFSWQYQYHPNLTLRSEIVSDKTLTQKGTVIAVLGFTWQYNWLTQHN